MKISAYMLSCPERDAVRTRTLASLKACDWKQPARVVLDRATTGRRQDRQELAAFKLLQKALEDRVELILFLEDDLDFNLHLRYNLEHWEPLAQFKQGEHFYGSLYNPNVGELERRPERATMIARPETVYGSQAVVLSRATVAHMLAHWDEVPGMQDIKMSRLAGQVTPLYYHLPSLVQHTGVNSVWGGHFHTARDFQARWKASSPVTRPASVVTNDEPAENLPVDEILRRVRPIQGWLEEDEAALLIRATARAARRRDADMVEVGSYCGKATLAVALTLKALKAPCSPIRSRSIRRHGQRPGWDCDAHSPNLRSIQRQPACCRSDETRDGSALPHRRGGMGPPNLPSPHRRAARRQQCVRRFPPLRALACSRRAGCFS